MGAAICGPSGRSPVPTDDETIPTRVVAAKKKGYEFEAMDKIERAKKELERYVRSLDEEALAKREQAKKELRAGRKAMALTELKGSKTRERIALNVSRHIEQLDALQGQIGQAIATRATVAVLREGTEELKRVAVPAEEVDKITQDLSERIRDVTDSIEAMVSGGKEMEAAANGGVEYDEEELERELQALIEPPKHSDFPAVPTTQPSATSSRSSSSVTRAGPKLVAT